MQALVTMAWRRLGMWAFVFSAVLLSASIAGADTPLTPYVGAGTLVVTGGGDVLVIMSDLGENQGVSAVIGERGLWPVYTEGIWTITDSVPQLAAAAIPLDEAEGGQEILEISGDLSVVPPNDKDCIVTAYGNDGNVFETVYSPPFTPHTRASSCTVSCANGDCECSGYLICSCTCTKDGNPRCIGLFPWPFAIASASPAVLH